MTTPANANSNQELKTVPRDGIELHVIREGLAEILVPKTTAKPTPDDASTGQKTKEGGASRSVFYNPIQQFNRDLSVLAIRVYAEDCASVQELKDAHVKANGKGKKRKRKRDDAINGEDQCQAKLPRVGNVAEETNAADQVGETEASEPNFPEFKKVEPPRGVNTDADPNACEGPAQAQKNVAHNQTPTEPRPKGPSSEPYKRPFKILDALSATGLRALRYAQEIPQVTFVAANDLSPSATAAIKRNILHNGLGSRIQPTTGNATQHMYQIGNDAHPLLPDGSRGKYHVIDLDPYGTAVPFLDAAVQALADGGLLGVTCTDAAVFASAAYAEKTYSLYGGLPLKGPHAHEGGIRLVLHAIAGAAAKYGIAIEPLLSLSIDFYMRVFVRLRRAPHEVKHLANKTMAVYSCDSGCGSWAVQPLGQTQERMNKNNEPWYKFSLPQAPVGAPLCEHCDFKTHLGGPMWGGPLHNPFFIQRMLDLLPSLSKETYGTKARMVGMLTLARDETLLPTDFKSPSQDPPLEASAIPRQESPREPAPATNTPANDPPTHSHARIPRLPPTLREPVPFFLYPSILARALHTTAPSNDALRGALRRLGYRAVRTHSKPGSLRTDAPWAVVWEIMRRWARKQQGETWAPAKGTAGGGIWSRGSELAGWKEELTDVLVRANDVTGLRREIEALLWRLENKEGGPNEDPKTTNGDAKDAEAQRDPNDNALALAKGETGPVEDNGDARKNAGTLATSRKAGEWTHARLAALNVVFDEALGREEPRKGLVRYQMNPAPNWGPMSKAH